MKPRHSVQPPNSSSNEDAESSLESLTDSAMLHFTSVLDDFLDEEVVDRQGKPIGTLACYWKSVSGQLIFLGIKLEGQQGVRIVPGRPSQVDHRQACIRLGFEAKEIESAPHFECDNELNAAFERSVYEHFRVGEAQPHDGLQYVTRRTRPKDEA